MEQSSFICCILTGYEAILFLQVGVEYFHGVLVKTEINYSALCNDEYLSLPTNLNGDTSEGEKRGSFLGLGLPEFEILGLFPSILDISRASFFRSKSSSQYL